jgi:hypothetical protein
MSRIRETHHRRLEALAPELRREDDEVREEHHAPGPPPAETVGPEVEDPPLGVPADPEQEDELESPGFPRDDPTHG